MGDTMVWADIPVADMDRAKAFYSTVLGQPVMGMPGAEDEVAVIGTPSADQGPVVSVDLYTGGTPSRDGATVYFATGGDIDGMPARVNEAGGEILQDKQFMGEMVGWIAFVLDSEGNRIGFQQPGA
jgi:predicted enzyme related to lactoylglutathione lyase